MPEVKVVTFEGGPDPAPCGRCGSLDLLLSYHWDESHCGTYVICSATPSGHHVNECLNCGEQWGGRHPWFWADGRGDEQSV